MNSEVGASPSRLALSIGSDLMFGSRLAAAATRTGLTVQQVGNLAMAVGCLAAQQVGLIIVDLSSAALDPTDAIGQLRAAGGDVPIVAFGPHVHEGRLAAAREAGASEVLSRGAFDAQMDTLLQRYLA
ncbi:MAG: hypothetical protein AB7U73_04750 [Pirellulales bacterium]